MRSRRRRLARRPAQRLREHALEMSSATRAAKTTASRSEFEASRLAPCAPVEAVSPQAQRPSSVVRPPASVRSAAHVVVLGRRDRDRLVDRIDAGIAAVAIDGRKLLREILADRRTAIEEGAAAGSDLGVDGAGDDVARREFGAAGGRLSMKRSPAALTRIAPSPRSASVRSGAGSRPTASAVGWNWTNSGVGDNGAGAGGHADAAASGLGRVGGDRKEMADAAGRRARPRAAAMNVDGSAAARPDEDAGDRLAVAWPGSRRHSPRGRGSTACCVRPRPAPP